MKVSGTTKKLNHDGFSKDAILAKTQEHSIYACDTLHFWKLKMRGFTVPPMSNATIGCYFGTYYYGTIPTRSF